MEQYLECLGLPDEETKVKVAAQFLMRDAKMWWWRMDQITSGSADDITSWDDMKKDFQTHFSPQDGTWEARMKIKYIKQTGSLQTYQREFASAVLKLLDMVERDKVFNFIIGPKPWACNEVKRQKIKTLEEAFTTVDRLVEHYDETSDEKKKKFDKPKEKSTKDDASKSNDKSKTKKSLKCWICAEAHTILGAAAATEAVSRRDSERNNLEYVRMKVGGTNVLTMVDSGATHNFMSEDVARRIGLKFVSVKA
eukprot:PITA_24246